MKNKLLRILLSAAIAISIWLYVVTVVAPNTDKTYSNIPVAVQSEALLQERKLMITGMDVDMITLQLEGSRLDLNKLNSSNIIVTIDASKIYEAGVHPMQYSIAYPGDVAYNAINVINRNPGYINVNVEVREEKSVPVEIDYSGNLPENFVSDAPVLSREVVNISGPKSVIDRITSARVQVDLEGRSESFSEQLQYTLCDKNGQPVDAKLVTTDAADVTVTWKILRVKEIALVVNVIFGGGATEMTSTVTVDPLTIRVSGSDSLLAGLEQLELGTINLEEMSADEVLTFPIKLPEGINNETGVTEATVDVRFINLATTTLRVTKINAINVPEGMDVELITKALEIMLRGPEGQINNLKPEDITVTVDFTDVQAGTVKIKAVITVNNAPDVGAVGVYMISATVRGG